MDFKKLLDNWGKLLIFLVGLVIVPILTAIPVAANYDISPQRVYIWFTVFYIVSFLLVAIPSWIKYAIRTEIKKIMQEENDKNVRTK